MITSLGRTWESERRIHAVTAIDKCLGNWVMMYVYGLRGLICKVLTGFLMSNP
jgi:hypothetical protein